jgi:hypothetical protein
MRRPAIDHDHVTPASRTAALANATWPAPSEQTLANGGVAVAC